jgi:hypothetical protein
MVEPVTIIVVGAGIAMLITSMVAALSITFASAVSSPEDKYDNSKTTFFEPSTQHLTSAYTYSGFRGYPQPFAARTPYTP